MDPQDLETTQPSAPADAGVKHPGLPPPYECCQAGILLSLDEVNKVPWDGFVKAHELAKAQLFVDHLN